MMTDIEIAQSTQMLPIAAVADKLGVNEEQMELYGRYKAKIDLSLLQESERENGKLTKKAGDGSCLLF